jgi:hypothetical protein
VGQELLLGIKMGSQLQREGPTFNKSIKNKPLSRAF